MAGTYEIGRSSVWVEMSCSGCEWRGRFETRTKGREAFVEHVRMMHSGSDPEIVAPDSTQPPTVE